MMPRTPRPSLVGEDIVCVSSIDWDFLWQAHQEIMTRLAADGNPVLFIENTGVRTPNLSDLPRILKRLRNWWGGVQGFRERAPNLIVLSPLLLPFPYSHLSGKINSWLLARSIRNWVGATRRSSPVLWTFLPTPLVNDVIDEIDPSLVVYYCADNLAASSAAAGHVAESERRLFERADLVFATSREIQARASRSRETAHYFPFGVDFAKFSASGGGPEPADISAVPRPRVGYVGGLHRWVDFALLRRAALERPAVHFVFVGPAQTDVSELQGLPNVHLLGAKPHDELPSYIAAFDAAVIPYRLTEYTASVYPTKLNEYFALGVPVVSTRLPEVSTYDAAHGGIVRIAGGPEEFLTSLDAAIAARRQDTEPRVAAARSNGWDQRVAEMSALIIEALERRRSETQVPGGVLLRISARRWTSSLVAAGAVLATAAVLRWTPAAWRLAEPLRLSADPTSADAVVVLGGGAGESGEIGQGHQERIERAVQLRNAGFVPRIVLCSGKLQTYSESEVMRAIALAKGVPASDVLVEPQANGTREMLTAAARLAHERRWKRVLLVSSPYHMRRAVRGWHRLAPDIEGVPTPVVESRFYSYRNNGRRRAGGATLRQWRGLLQEAATLAYYIMKGWA